jgi:primosomal protein N' (replication factor Y)
MMFAEIAVNRRVQGTFHYHIPDTLSDLIAPGHLVKVPFGTAHTTGIVIALHDHAPIPQTKPVLERLDPVPVITPAQLELAGWLSRETLAPLGLCLWLMLPPGIAKRGDLLYTLVDPDAGADLSKPQMRLVSLLHRRGPLRGRQIAHALPRVRWQSSLAGLVRRGIVRQDPILEKPDVGPKTVRTAQLSIAPERIKDIAPRLGRESRRANVLEVLLTARQQRMTVSAVMAAVGCAEGPIRTLVQAGDLRQTVRETWVELTVAPAEIAAHLEAGDYARARAQRQVLQQLLEARGSLPLSALNAAAVGRLEKAGTVRRWTDPATVEPVHPLEAVTTRIIELRGGTPYLAVLEYLAQAGGAVALREVTRATGTTLAHLRRLAEDELVALGEAETWRDSLSEQEFLPTVAPPLTAEQRRVWETVQGYMDTIHWGEVSPAPDVSGVFVLHGVTGSGKTEIYLRAVERALAQGRQAIVLVPEIALTPQTVRRFASRFPGSVAVVHSGLSVGERYDTWRRARAGQVRVVVGARSALFTPLPDVGLVILDEEHDDSYKQSPPVAPPYYHARATAIALMRITRGTVLLGSATPDVSTFFRAERGDYHLLSLPDRVIAHRERIAELTRRLNAPQARYHPTDTADAVYADLPAVHVVDMRQELRAGNRSIFSRLLHSAISEVLERAEQAILFLNRRGTATFIMCRDCGYIAMCPRCSTPLTYHSPREALICHYCGYTTGHITVCPACNSQRIRHFGQGTELIEAAVREEFPKARAIRWDADTVAGADGHDKILRAFAAHRADILIGTQMVAKGLDLPQVTLVGIVSADTALGLPDYRSGERTFQLLTQVAGRAGRGALGGRVVLQSYLPEHYAVRAAARHDYLSFYQQEIAHRRDQRFPPFRRLARLIFQYPTAERAEAEAQRARLIIERRISAGQFTATEIIGPTPCFFARRNDLYRWHLVIRSANPAGLLEGVDISEDWIVDIDPVDML